MKTIRERIDCLKRIVEDDRCRLHFSERLNLCEAIDWMSILAENPPKLYCEEHKGSRVNNVFVFQCSEIKDPVDCGVHMLKPCIHKYFKDHNYNESTSKVEKQMAIVALCHRIEEGLIDYLDELEEFNS